MYRFPEDNEIVSIRMCLIHEFWHAYYGHLDQDGYYPVVLDYDHGDKYDLADVRVKIAEDTLKEVKHAQRTIPSGLEPEV